MKLRVSLLSSSRLGSLSPSRSRPNLPSTATTGLPGAERGRPLPAKLERLPEYFRDTMDWLIGRSRRKADGKENAACVREGPCVPRRGGSWDEGSRSAGADFSVCDAISESDFQTLVRLPDALDSNEWLATHALAFFHHVNALYGCVAEFCTAESCPVMAGPSNVQLPWMDDRGKKCKYSAPQYVDCVMSFVEKSVCSGESFPTKYGQTFPSCFDSELRKTCRLLWHVMGHLYASHWEDIAVLGLRAQAAAVATHFHAFSGEFSLLDAKDLSGLAEICRCARPVLVSILSHSDSKQAPEEEERASTELQPLQPNNWSGSGHGSFGQPCAQTA